MAGLGTKLWTSGEVVTAANVNGYIQDQTIGKFASTTTRDAAFGGVGEPTLSEGMFAYTSDTNTLWSYDGSDWVAVLGSNIGAIQTSNRNRVINGAMQIAQRGSVTIGASGYSLDMYRYAVATGIPTGTISQQTFTPGTAPVAGYEGSNFARINITAYNGCTLLQFAPTIEDVRTFAGQTATFSFYAKADASSTFGSIFVTQTFGSGGSADVNTGITLNSTALTSSWTRYTGTVAVPSISGKTIGAGSSVRVVIAQPNSGGVLRNGTYDYWGVQLEAGSVATPFEVEDIGTTLAKCQRYYFRTPSTTAQSYANIANGFSGSSTNAEFIIHMPVTMRVAPTSFDSSAAGTLYISSITGAGAATTIGSNGYRATNLSYGIILISSGLTAGQAVLLFQNATSVAYLAASAELG
tara:strand:- start:230 stop:1459 length:1230 start_codon:yes stop_codon:yes gene_type:complete